MAINLFLNANFVLQIFVNKSLLITKQLTVI